VAKALRVRPALHLRPVRDRAKRRVENKKDMGPTANPALLRVDLHPRLSAGRENRRVERRKARKLLLALVHNKRDKPRITRTDTESEPKIHPPCNPRSNKVATVLAAESEQLRDLHRVQGCALKQLVA
jgi:hypothetical protein